MKNFFKKNKIVFLIALVLLIIPFFWFKNGEVNYGGDSSRLYFYDPWGILKNEIIYSVNSLGCIGADSAYLAMIPLYFVFALLKMIFWGKDCLLNNFWNGFVLAGGFIFTYLTTLEILSGEKSERRNRSIAIVCSLFFVISPALIYSWDRALESLGQFLTYPAVFFLFLRYLKTGKIKFLLAEVIFFFLSAVNFTFWSAPYLFSFFSIAVLFFYFYARICRQTRRFISGIVVMVFLFFLANFFHLIPQFLSFFGPSTSAYKFLFVEQVRTDWGLQYFLSVLPHIRLAYNWATQPQYVIDKGYSLPFENVMFNFGVKYLFAYLSFPIVVVWGMVSGNKAGKKFRSIQCLLLLIFLLLSFLMTANITTIGPKLYISFFNFPGFSMFRSFYSKFSFVFTFFYALLLAVSLYAVFEATDSVRKRYLILLLLSSLIVFAGSPLLIGRVVNGTLWLSNDIRIPTKIDPKYEVFLQKIKEKKEIFRVFGLPVAGGDYQILKGAYGGAYLGPSTITFLAGKRSFSGMTGFFIYSSQVEALIREGNYQGLKNLFGLFNIGYLFHNQDDYIYNNFPGYPYYEWEKKIFPNQESIKKFVQDLKFQEIFSSGNYHFYLSQQLLPLFYLSQRIICTNGGLDTVKDSVTINDYNSRSAFFLNGICPLEKPGETVVETYSSDLLRLEAESQLSEEKIVYPFVKKRQGFFRRLVLLKENLEKRLLSRELDSLISKKFFYANKRLSEAILLGEENETFPLYETELNETVSLIEKIKNPAKQWQTAFQLKRQLKDNRERIASSSLANKAGWQTFIVKITKQAESLSEPFAVQKRKFSFEALADGHYSILLREQSRMGGEYLSGELQDSQWLIDGKEIPLSRLNFKLDEDGWIKSNSLNLAKGEHDLDIKFNSLADLSAKDDWQKSSTGVEKTINGWRPEVWYRLEGKIKPGSGTKIILEEEYKGVDPKHPDLGEIPQRRLVKIIDPDPTTGEFSLNVRSSESALSAKVKITGTQGEKINYLADLEKLQTFPVLDPRLILVSADKELADTELAPKITFVRVNPTKYYLRVEGAKKPFALVFSQNFSQGWKLYKTKAKDFKVITASYFNGEIKEGDHKNIFIDKNVFETLGKKSLAEKEHFSINGYANAWYITPEDVGGDENYELIVEFAPQRLVYLGLAVSLLTFIVCGTLLLGMLTKRR